MAFVVIASLQRNFAGWVDFGSSSLTVTPQKANACSP